MENFEKLGSFYLGKKFDLKSNSLTNEIILYDSKDLTTHALCIGMTGSGKTGLCISLLEEAAIDSIPAIIIDPKGDMGNLKLAFDGLTKEEFLPWVNESEAEKNGLTKEQFAEQQASLWKKGLGDWGQSSDRIKMMKDKVEVEIYTPGSSSGIPISILESLSLDNYDQLNDADAIHDKIESVVGSLLGLLNLNADPLTSREHILLSAIFNHYWQNKNIIDLALLINAVQNPPFEKLGVFDLSSFFPQNDRLKLAMMLNNLLASPSFQTWLNGEPMNINNFLYTPTGKPKLSIISIAHLSDTERMFFVSLLLNQLISWMRVQPGTSSLRAILYFDELFGYLPPVSNPPSKKALMTLLKQARAFGLGLVLATQNPVDIDYKALSNTGTWLIGRLQTEQDINRLIDGLMSSSGSDKFNKNEITSIISGLGKRKFLLHNVHENEPVVFGTRWALSYLAGPLTKSQISTLKSVTKSSTKNHVQHILNKNVSTVLPVIDSSIKQFYIPYRGSAPSVEAKLTYKPFVWGSANVLFSDTKKQINQESYIARITPIENTAIAVDWLSSESTDISEDELLTKPEAECSFSELPKPASVKASYSNWEKDFKDFIFRNHKLDLLKSPTMKITSKPNESEREFRIMLNQAFREQRDQWVEKLRDKYSKKIISLESKIRTAEERVAREADQAKQQKVQTAISIGTTLLGSIFGRKTFSSGTLSKTGTAMRGASRTMKETADVKRAEEALELLLKQRQELDEEFEREVNLYSNNFDATLEKLETESIYPKKTNISINLFCLVWAPFWLNKDGNGTKAF